MAEWSKENYVISDDPSRIDFDVVHRMLTNCYWSPGISKELVIKAAQGSFVLGIYKGQEQVGYARVITDRATFAYLCDVIIDEKERGQGLGKWLMERLMAHPELQGLRRWMLATRDAHELYKKFGWEPLKEPERFMQRHFPNIYSSVQ